MNAKSFIFAVAALVILGIILGGAFIGGVAIGRTQAESEEPEMSFIQAPSAQGGVAAAGGRTMGTVKSVGDGIMTVETFQGTIQVNVDSDTTVQGLTDVPLSDVEVDSMAVVVGESTESGELDASSIIVLPEGILGAGGFRRSGAGAGVGRGGQ